MKTDENGGRAKLMKIGPKTKLRGGRVPVLHGMRRNSEEPFVSKMLGGHSNEFYNGMFASLRINLRLLTLRYSSQTLAPNRLRYLLT